MADEPRRWWQWMLMYPAFGLALLGAAPQFYQWTKALTLGLSPGANVGDVEGQLDAWTRNASCDHNSQRLQPTAQTQFAIDIVTCPTGDILVTLTPPAAGRRPVYRWILTNDLFQRSAFNLLGSTAMAQGAAHPPGPVPVRVLGIVPQGSMVTRRVQRSDGTCVDERINAVTGQQVSVSPAPCVPLSAH